ncbi:hypothetical protein GJ496_000671 [Pomphorhynchus laevis]|nr:hypothetical protein GJ496_000671 [Pomphorhynchus laevis]
MNAATNCTDSLSVNLFLSARWMRKIVIPIILIFGWPGNFMLYRTMQNSLYQSMHMSIFFRAIAIVDSIFLIGVLARWLESMEFVNLNKLTDCAWILVIVFSTQSTTNWLLLFTNLDRLLFVLRKDLCTRIFTRRNCILISISIACVFTISMLHWPFILHYNSSNYQFSGTPCVFKPYAAKWGNIGWPIVYNTICLALPFFGILLCSLILVHYVTIVRKRLGKDLRTKERQSLNNTIILSLFYLGTTLPYGTVQAFTSLFKSPGCHAHSAWILINVACLLLVFLNYSMKFYLIAAQTKVIRKNLASIVFNRNINQSSGKLPKIKNEISQKLPG